MTTKVTDGILYRTHVSKVNMDENIKRLHEHFSGLKGVQKLSSIDAHAVKTHTMEILHDFQRKAQSTFSDTNSEKVLLNLVHRMAITVIFVSDRMVRISAPYLPEKGEKLINIAANYVQNVNQGISEAQTLEEVKQKTLEEAKNSIVFVSSTFLYVINFARANFWSRLTKVSPFITNQEYAD